MRSRVFAFPTALVVAAFALTLSVFEHLPERFPTHWNVHGEPDGYGGPASAFMLPLVMLAMWLFAPFLERASPKGYELAASKPAYSRTLGFTMVFLLAIHAFMMFSALRAIHIAPRSFVLPALGLFFACIGNVLGKVRRNFFLGIRTPWTLADDEVWSRTHRLAGKLMVLAGLATFVLGFVPQVPGALLTGALIAAGLAPCVYSYVLYRRLNPDDARGAR